ncbi:hypothetical protein [Ralstonia insidiosa]|uniref:Uncharacterized protein n=1 Tax=Ralstonia insidiosa TaxID=190721 RepID=A0A848P464_9RALS|nr:hypothetical protein [Ralstonia insidiosa]NMV40317.1 hypothetical protein [Ralstonia insidiosa]
MNMSPAMLRTLLTVIGAAALFSGCAAPTASVVGPANADKLRAVKTIAIATPLNVSYYTTTGAVPTVLFPGAGVIANMAIFAERQQRFREVFVAQTRTELLDNDSS